MTVEARLAPRARLAQAEADRATVPLFPTLWPHMLLGRARTVWPFPLQRAGARNVFLARYGIYEAARALGLSGREVLFPAFFHSVELDALVAAGALVRFFPVSRRLGIDPDEVAARIGPRTAAVYVIHYGGFPTAIRELRDLCRTHGLALIEDCAHALLSYADDQ